MRYFFVFLFPISYFFCFHELNSSDIKIDYLALSNDQTTNSNIELAKKIMIASHDVEGVNEIISSKDFLIEPTYYLLVEMIERGVGGARMDDGDRAFVMSQIPGFLEKATSPDYLRSFAVYYFKNNPDRLKIMKIFEKSLSSDEFKKDLAGVREAVNIYGNLDRAYFYIENALRAPLTIFRQSAALEQYRFPSGSLLE